MGCWSCHGAGTSAPPAPAKAALVDPAAWPAEAVALADVDLGQLRQSPLWPFLRQIVGEHSRAADACLLDQAQRIWFSVYYAAGSDDEESSMAFAAIYQGMPAPAARACLTGLRGDARAAPAPTPALTSDPARACRAFSAAVGALTRCGKVPRSSVPALARVRELVRGASDASVEQVCAQAQDAWAAAAARCAARTQGDETAHDPFLRPLGEPEIKHEVFVTADDQWLHFSKAGHVAIVDRIGVQHGTAMDRAMDAAAAFSGPQPWLAGLPAAGLTAGTITVLAAPTPLKDFFPGSAGAEADLPRSFVATIDARAGVTVQLKTSGLSAMAQFTMARLLGALGDVLEEHRAMPTMTASCATTESHDPWAGRCAAALDNARRLRGAPASAMDQVDRADGLAGCIEARTKDHVTCMGQATSKEMLDKCQHVLRDQDEARAWLGRPFCGTGELSLELKFPLLAFVKLAQAWAAEQRPLADCVATDPEAREVSEASAQPDAGEDAADAGAPAAESPRVRARLIWETETPPGITACFPGSGCWRVDLGTSPVHGDGEDRFSLVDDWPMDFVTCQLGPATTTAASGFRDWSVGAEHCDIIDRDTTGGILRVGRQVNQRREVSNVPMPKATQAIGVSADQSRAVFVDGQPGKQFLETWDLTTNRRLARFAAGTTAQRPCARAQLLGATIAVSTGPCNQGPDARVTPQLLSIQGKPLASVRGQVQPLPLPLGGSRWGFVTAQGNAVLVYDVATGALTKQLDTGLAPSPDPVTAAGDNAGRFALAYGEGALAGAVVVGDVATGTTRTFRLSRCPQAGAGK